MHIWIGNNKMIIRRETLNEISTLKSNFNNPELWDSTWESFIVKSIASTLNLAAADVADAIKAFKL
jgi:hypothetical protein